MARKSPNGFLPTHCARHAQRAPGALSIDLTRRPRLPVLRETPAALSDVGGMHNVLATSWPLPGALMAFYGRSPSFRRRQQERERENAWSICPKHGGYNPMQMTLGGRWVMGPCQKCAAERYEASKPGQSG